MAFVASRARVRVPRNSAVVGISFRFGVRVAVDALERRRVRLIRVTITAKCPAPGAVAASRVDREEGCMVERRRLPTGG